MPKVSANPGLRVHRWKSSNGNVSEYYYFDMRGAGKPDIALGPDRADALVRWKEIVDGKPPRPWVRPTVGSMLRSERRLKPLATGKRRSFNPDTWAGLPAWAKPMYLGAERRAAGAVNFMSVDDFRGIVERSAGKCELTGLELDQRSGSGRRPLAPSIDRIDASKGYIAGNVRIVCLMANQALSEWGDAPVLAMAEALSRKTTSAKP